MTPYTFGTMSLGRNAQNFRQDVIVARSAMEKKLWFHSSRAYGDGGTFEVLKQAFNEDRAQVPKTIFKIGCENADLIKRDVAFTLKTLGLGKLDVAQLAGQTHEKRDIVADFLAQGPMFQVCQTLKAQGLVDSFVFEIFYTYAADALKAVKHNLFDGYIFYYSVLERQVSNEIWDSLIAQKLPLLSLRPVAGSFLSGTEKLQARREKDPHHPAFLRLDELQPVLELSGCATLLELSLRFLASQPQVKTTIAGTASLTHLAELESSVRTARPLEPSVVEAVQHLHQKWCRQDEKYQFAKELW